MSEKPRHQTSRTLRLKNWTVVLALLGFAALIYFVTVVRVGEGERVRAAEMTPQQDL